MKPKRYSSEALILSRNNFSEADRILVVFSKDYGKLSMLAKGVRKPKSRKRGSVEIFSHIKFSAAKGKNLDLITEAEILNDFSEARKNLRKVAVAYYFVEVVNKITREDEVNIKLFEFLLENLKGLISNKNLKKQREEFVTELLIILGFWPEDRELADPDNLLETVLERKVSSKEIGKKLLT